MTARQEKDERLQLCDRDETVFTLPIDPNMKTLGPKELGSFLDA